MAQLVVAVAVVKEAQVVGVGVAAPLAVVDAEPLAVREEDAVAEGVRERVCVALAVRVVEGDAVADAEPLAAAEADTLAESLAASQDRAESAGRPVGYLERRLREALDLVVRTGEADSLEDHLKYLSDLDAARAAQSYGLVRFVIWAVPIMGFLGTVIGITEAIAQLSPTQLDNISGVVAGLGVEQGPRLRVQVQRQVEGRHLRPSLYFLIASSRLSATMTTGVVAHGVCRFAPLLEACSCGSATPPPRHTQQVFSSQT
jgi:hypothetical protein